MKTPTSSSSWPGKRGFQHYYGIHNYVDSYTDIFTDKAILYMDNALDQGKPFFQ